MKKIRILIAEDHKLIRETWTSMLNLDERFHVIAACSDTTAAIAVARKQLPDIVLMDINILPLNGFQATESLSKISPNLKVIALSYHSDMYCVQKMFAAGAKGYLTKNSGYKEMIDAIVRVHAGNNYVCSEIREKGYEVVADSKVRDYATTRLTDQEKIVSHFIHDGLRSKEIAGKLNISIRTVASHRYNIFKKLNITSALSLVSLLNFNNGDLKFREMNNTNNKNEMA